MLERRTSHPGPAAARSDLADPLHAELGAGHHRIRTLLDQLDANGAGADRVVLADELAREVAGHRARCTEQVLDRVRGWSDGADLELQVRLLHSAIRGIDRLTDRLRLPARDPALVPNVLVALRALVHEHERLEVELVVATAATAAPGHGG